MKGVGKEEAAVEGEAAGGEGSLMIHVHHVCVPGHFERIVMIPGKGTGWGCPTPGIQFLEQCVNLPHLLRCPVLMVVHGTDVRLKENKIWYIKKSIGAIVYMKIHRFTSSLPVDP